MENKIIKREKNVFLEREEIVLEIKNDVTPTYDEVKAEIGSAAKLTVIKRINTNFGKRIFMVDVVVYDNIEALKKIETIPQKVRKKMAADKKVEEEADKKVTEADKKTEIEASEEKPIKNEAPVEERTEEVKEEIKTKEKIEND